MFVDAALNRTMDQLTPTQLHPVAATTTVKTAPKAAPKVTTAKAVQTEETHHRASAASMKAIREQLHQMGYLQNDKGGE